MGAGPSPPGFRVYSGFGISKIEEHTTCILRYATYKIRSFFVTLFPHLFHIIYFWIRVFRFLVSVMLGIISK